MALDFVTTKYESNSGVITKCKIESASVAFAGTPPSGSIELGISAIVSKSKRTAGLHARTAVLSREVGTAPNKFTKYKEVALLTPARATAVEGLINTTVTIGGTEWKVESVKGEVVK